MAKKILLLILISFFFNNFSYGVLGTNKEVSNPDETTNEPKGPKKDSNYKKAERSIKKGKKLELKGKLEKAKIRYEKALKFLYKANNDNPLQENILRDLGFVSQKLDNFQNAEIYYLLGLELNSKNRNINKLLGKLYVDLNKIQKAKERLKVLENCNCSAYVELNNAIKSK